MAVKLNDHRLEPDVRPIVAAIQSGTPDDSLQKINRSIAGSTPIGCGRSEKLIGRYGRWFWMIIIQRVSLLLY